MVVTLGQHHFGAFFCGTVHLLFKWPSQSSAVTPSVQATGDFDGNLCISVSSVEVLVVVRAGVIKLLEYPPDRQGFNWLLPKLFTEK